MRKSLIGSIVRIPLSDGSYAFGRLIEEVTSLIYDFKTEIETPELEFIISHPILFAVICGDLSRQKEGCKIIGKLPLDERHLITPSFFDVQLLIHLMLNWKELE